jgi:type IV fimbrial biogenesis protein FimT
VQDAAAKPVRLDSASSGRAARGLSLVELLVVLLCLAVLLVVVLPGASQLVAANQARIQVDRLMRAVNLARSEAIARNRPVSLCPSPVAPGVVPHCGGNYAQGWMVFSNDDRDRVVDAGRDEVLQVFHGLPPGYRVTNRAGTREADELITYRADGSAPRTATLQVCPPAASGVGAQSLVLNLVGRPRRVAATGACPQ